MGPEVKFAQNAAEDNSFIVEQQPYGFGDFGQVGAHLILDGDTKGRVLAGMDLGGLTEEDFGSDTKLKYHLEGRIYPAVWDVEETFGHVDGFTTGYLQVARNVTLAARVGGKSVWGDYPWHESAFLGDSRNVRGYERNRFAGDSSVYGNAQIMLGLFNVNFILPLRVGVLGLADVGRVWLDEEESDKWHPAYGGGLYIKILPTPTAFHALVASGDEGWKAYVNVGFGI